MVQGWERRAWLNSFFDTQSKRDLKILTLLIDGISHLVLFAFQNSFWKCCKHLYDNEVEIQNTL